MRLPAPATAVKGSGSTTASSSPTLPSAQKFDCFYVYPTVSTEQANNADLAIQPAELAVAASQASRLLPGVPGLGAHVPAGDGAGADPRRHHQRHGLEHRLRQPARRMARLHPTRQRRPSHRLHRALAGGGDTHPSSAYPGRPLVRSCAASWSRPSSSAATCRCPTGRRVGRQLPAHPDVRLGHVDGLRHRLFDLRLYPAPSGPLRPARARGEHSVRADHADRSAGGLRQPRDLLAARRVRCSHISCRPPPKCRVSL